ncbi:MAG: phosphopantetheine-binding protein [Actinomycetota bacterium]|nr:phosphopantetheine-binding protein [Actinomycetota bacterium]
MNVPAAPAARAAVIAVCSELLGIDEIAGSDNFFMLGGTSLTVIELTEGLLARYGLELSLDAVFSSETLDDLALCCTPAAARG